ncbi:MAG: DUF29 domain-containing protein [Pseudanabaenaceae cyanobacterium bins.68]|nr:DUF29 domain-containing protein [Pseudanabaenaceae cyanobacterium bins.68]
MTISLYETDLNLWCEETLTRLKSRDFDHLDIENLIEEIAALASRDRRELQSRLGVLVEHLLKRKYVDSCYDFRGWELTIKEQLRQIEMLLKQSPSLKGYLIDVLPQSYQFALSQVQIGYPHIDFPKEFGLANDADAFLKLMERDLVAFQMHGI